MCTNISSDQDGGPAPIDRCGITETHTTDRGGVRLWIQAGRPSRAPASNEKRLPLEPAVARLAIAADPPPHGRRWHLEHARRRSGSETPVYDQLNDESPDVMAVGAGHLASWGHLVSMPRSAVPRWLRTYAPGHSTRKGYKLHFSRTAIAVPLVWTRWAEPLR